MIYLYWYLGIGAVVLILMVIFNKLTEKKDEKSLSDYLADLRPERKKLWFRLLNDVLGPALVGTLVVPFWPVIVYFKVKQVVFGEADRGPIDGPKFAVTREYLQEPLSLSEIEEREMVCDPLNAAPNVPFGHLNTAWQKYCDGLDPLDSLWSFTAHWTNEWDRKEIRQGYVLVRGEVIGRYFITVWKDAEEEAAQDIFSSKKAKGFDIPAWFREQAD